MEVTNAEFDIASNPEWKEQLYVPVAKARSADTFEKMLRRLGYYQGKFSQPGSYNKILFSGHRGSGKTTELMRLAEEIEAKGDYVVVRLYLDQQQDVGGLQPDDVYMLCLNALYQQLKKLRADWGKALPEGLFGIFEELGQAFTKNITKFKTITETRELSAEAGGGVKLGFWDMFELKFNLSGREQHTESETQRVETRVRDQLGELLPTINRALGLLGHFLQGAGLPENVLFVIDGFEKTLPPLYEHLFLRDVRFIAQLQAHVVCCVPINTYYEVKRLPLRSLYVAEYLPMLRVNAETVATLIEMITKRVHAGLFEDGVLAKLAEYSGGSPRQMFTLVNLCFLNMEGERVQMQEVERTIREYGIELFRRMSAGHHVVLQQKRFYDSDAEVLEMLYGGMLLEYNGSSITREVNPVLKAYFTHHVVK